MNREELETKLIDYIDCKLSAEETVEVQNLLAVDATAHELHRQLKEVMQVMDASPELEPDQRMKQRFERLLTEEMHAMKEKRTVFFTPIVWRAAASIALLVAATGIGYWIYRDYSREKELTALRGEVQKTKELMLIMLQNRQSASQRIQAVNTSYQMQTADQDVIQALVKSLNEDPNTNVRMAALDALGRFSQEPEVRKALIAALPRQEDPIVKIALIEWMVKMKEKTVVKELENIVNDSEQMKAVKDAAYSGILKLS